MSTSQMSEGNEQPMVKESEDDVGAIWKGTRP